MIQIASFTFNPFQENTYLLYDETRECVIIDPGCYDEHEKRELAGFIEKKELKPVRLLNTHCHIDHILGNAFVSQKYGLKPEIHRDDLFLLQGLLFTAQMYQVNAEESPEPGGYLNEGDQVKFGNSTLDILFTPGHSPGSITFYNKDEKFAIVGDVLFNLSIGRTDLPGGDYDVLIHSITAKLLPLGDDVKVYAGHMDATTIGFERKHNPFLTTA
jgi:hydroxyacylglutathione hydrolase